MIRNDQAIIATLQTIDPAKSIFTNDAPEAHDAKLAKQLTDSETVLQTAIANLKQFFNKETGP